MNKACCFQIIKNHAAIKMRPSPDPRMDFQNILLSEKSRMHKIVCNMISFYK